MTLEDPDLCSVRVTFPYMEGMNIGDIGRMLTNLGSAMASLEDDRRLSIGRVIQIVAMNEEATFSIPVKIAINPLAPHMAHRMVQETKAVKEMFGGSNEQ